MTMSTRISGGLLRVLKVARVAWYHGEDGTRAYYEQPSPSAQGVVAINGQRVVNLVVDPEGLYLDIPSPQIQRMLIARGVDLERGWSCRQEAHGFHLTEAMEQSHHYAARHYNGRVAVQCVDEHHAAILLDGSRYCTVRFNKIPTVLAELGVETIIGWYPVQQRLL